jgi:predicted phosphohydrolase
MPNIKRFHLSYGSYFGSKEELLRENGRLCYRWGNKLLEHEVVLIPDDASWKQFLEAVRPLVKDWKRYYREMVCDGLT